MRPPLHTLAACALLLAACSGSAGELPAPSQPVEEPRPSGPAEAVLVSTSFSAGRDYPRVPAERSTIYMPQGDWSYTHHPHLTYFRGAFHAVCSNGRAGEDEPGQRVLIASSTDFRIWSAPRVVVDASAGSYGAPTTVTPGGIRVCEGRLVLYYTENDYDPEAGRRVDSRLYAVTSPDGEHWNEPVRLPYTTFPSQRPLRLRDGRLVMTGNDRFYLTDCPDGVEGWRKVSMGGAEQDQSGLITAREMQPNLCEGMLFEHRNGNLYCLFRNTKGDGYLWQSQSGDGGESWTLPVRSGFTDSNTKSCFLTLPDGRGLYVGTPDNSRPGERTPLVVALSEDGYRFDNIHILADDFYEMRYAGRWKGGQFGYPFAYVRDGRLYVVVSRRKERLDAIVCNLSDLKPKP